jgi:hypothetical protein
MLLQFHQLLYLLPPLPQLLHLPLQILVIPLN